MNKKRKNIISLALFILIIMALVPPWLGKASSNAQFKYIGHYFIWRNPHSISAIGRNDILVFNEKTRYGKKIDTTILTVQIALLLLIAAPWLLMAKNKKR